MTLINKSARLSINKLVNNTHVLIRSNRRQTLCHCFFFCIAAPAFSSYLRFILSAPIPINAASWNDFSFSTNAFRSSSANICFWICLIFSSCSSNCSCATLKRSSSCAFCVSNSRAFCTACVINSFVAKLISNERTVSFSKVAPICCSSSASSSFIFVIVPVISRISWRAFS